MASSARPSASSSVQSVGEGAAAATPTTTEWSRLVKVSLQPRLLRLPLLTLFFLHALLVAIHAIKGTGLGSFWAFFTLPLRPALLAASVTAFTLGILPSIVVRRRLLSRKTWQDRFSPPDVKPADVTILRGRNKLATSTFAGNAVFLLSKRSTWYAAFFSAVHSTLFSIPLLLSFAAYSQDLYWWAPYHQVPSVRKTTGNFGRTIETVTTYWRPNEVAWFLLLQPVAVGIVVSLARTLMPERSAVPLWRAPPFPLSLLGSLSSTSVGQSSTLSSRITSTLPTLIIRAAMASTVVSIGVLLVYLPLRLPLFRLILSLLPPYSALRRLVIPSLRAEYGLTFSKIIHMSLLANAVAGLYAATEAVAANLWEIYATHPLGITASSNPATSRPVETLLCALEIYSPRAPNSAAAAASSPSERSFLFTHALFDMTVLCTDTSPQGSDRRRAFFKHFAVPAVQSVAGGVGSAGGVGGSAGLGSSMASLLGNTGFGGGSGAVVGGSTGTVSAWERASEVLLALVKDFVENGAAGSDKEAATATSQTSAATAQATVEKGRQLEVRSGGVKGGGAAPSAAAAASARPSAVTSAIRSNSQAQSGGGQDEPRTVWQRLVAPSIAEASVSAAPPSSQQSSASQSQQQPSSSAPKPRPADPIDQVLTNVLSLIQSVFSSILRPALRLSLKALPAAQAEKLEKSFFPSASPSSSSRSTTTTPSQTLSLSVLHLHLLLTLPSTSTLLLFSLTEDEWGSVTLSERRGLGVEEWIKVLEAVAKRVEQDQPQGSSAAKEGSSSSSSSSPGGGGGGKEWQVLAQEASRAAEALKNHFGSSM